MEKTIGIRYMTPQGVEGCWTILRSAVLQNKDDDATLRAFLAHWHPDYTYLGKQTVGVEPALGKVSSGEAKK